MWHQQFSKGPVLKAFPDSNSLLVPVSPLEMSELRLRRWVAHIAYEEHAAIWSTLLGAHADCTKTDMDVFNGNEMPTRFTCPVAGAAWMSARMMGIEPQFSSGRWVVPRPRGGAGLTNAVFLVGVLPAAEVEEMVRVLVRKWTLELLAAFTSAAEAGQSFADWPGESARLPEKDQSIYVRYADIAGRADKLCGFKHVKPFRHVKNKF